jgi:hypothetical protein
MYDRHHIPSPPLFPNRSHHTHSSSWATNVEMTKLRYFTIAIVLISVSYQLHKNQLLLKDPTNWENPDHLPSLEGPWVVNNDLRHTLHLHIGDVTAPEAFAIDPRFGIVYASLSDGRVVSLSPEGNYRGTVFFTGGLRNNTSSTQSDFLSRICAGQLD